MNVISQMLFDKRHEVDDSDFAIITKFIVLIVEAMDPADITGVLPWIRHVYETPAYKSLKAGLKLQDPFCRRMLLEHRETYNPNKVRDFTDCLLKASLDEKVWREFGGKEYISDDILEIIIADIATAGIGTTVLTLTWIVVYLLHWPEVQEECYREIVEMCPHVRFPTFADRSRLPFVQGTIQEALRFSSTGILS